MKNTRYKIVKVDPEKLSDRLYEEMERQKVASQEDLHRKSGATQSIISNILNCKRDRYYDKNLDLIAKYLNVNTDWLIGRPYARKERVVTPEAGSLPQNNLFRQVQDAETPEAPNKKYSLEQLLLAQVKVLKSIDESLKALRITEVE